LLISHFDFELPDDLIAQEPVAPRDHSRLMVIDRKHQSWSHRTFNELPDLLWPGDLLVRNNSAVIPARLLGYRAKTGGKWEGLFLRELPDHRWEILAKTRGRPRPGELIIVEQQLELVLEAKNNNSGAWIVKPELDVDNPQSTLSLLQKFGQIPLPPYIERIGGSAKDHFSYQTVYAQHPGSVAAPTAGLHFTDELFKRLANSKITWVDLTLHVGVGTFRPLSAEKLEDHVMHPEWAELSAEASVIINTRRANGGRVIAVGTTSARVLETAAKEKELQPFAGETDLFIRPGHQFDGFDSLITNFHLPRSSLLVLVSAFAGFDLTRAAYDEAIRLKYRFFSYGDAMLIV
jgi:S-adenosylmethionine:tRNA ribosyltransferase-isomerase